LRKEGTLLRSKKRRFGSMRVIALSFLCVILVGSLLLMFPFASREGVWTHPLDAFFTATSATCVTGLFLFDVYTHWSLFGQIVILVLIQIGGLGFMTIMALFAFFSKRQMNLHKRQIFMKSIGNIHLGGVMSLTRNIFIGTFLFETVGAILLAFRFCPMMGFWEGVFNAIFHSISAFCNAGIDLMGKYGEFSSFSYFYDDFYVQSILMILIIVGGIGFFVWSDVLKHGRQLSNYTLHTKIILFTTVGLIVFGWLAFFLLERDGALAGLTLGEKILCSLFQSITTRTAGFVTVDQSELTGGGVLTIILMLIGGSPGSAAGGIKNVTTFVVLLSAITTIRRKDGCIVFKKKISEETVHQANAIAIIYISLLIFCSMAIMQWESVDMERALFEVTAAISTTGISMGMTPSIGTATKILLALLMFIGRVGGFSFVLVFAEGKRAPDIQRPTEKVLVG